MWLLKNGSEETMIQSLEGLTDFYIEIGETKTARVYLERLKKEKGDTDEILRKEAKLFYEERDFGSVTEKLMAIKKMKEEDLDLFMDTFMEAKDIEKAILFYQERLKESGGKADGYNKLAHVLEELHREDESLYYYRLALQRDPLNEWALYRVGSLDEREGKEILKKIKGEDPLIQNLAGEIMRELDIKRRLSEVF